MSRGVPWATRTSTEPQLRPCQTAGCRAWAEHGRDRCRSHRDTATRSRHHDPGAYVAFSGSDGWDIDGFDIDEPRSTLPAITPGDPMPSEEHLDDFEVHDLISQAHAEAAKRQVNAAMTAALVDRMGWDPRLRAWAESFADDDEPRSAHEAIADGVRRVIDAWAQDSTSHPISARVQWVIADRYGCGHLDWAAPDDGDDWVVDPHHEDDDVWVDHADAFLDAYVEAQYEATQKHLAERGVTSVAAHRGVGWAHGAAHAPADAATWTAEERTLQDAPVGIDLTAASSWSTERHTAGRFARMAVKDHVRAGVGAVEAVYTAQIPAERIWSTPQTGPGCLDEREVVVIGGPAAAWVRVRRFPPGQTHT